MLQVAPMFEINLVQWNIIFDLECISVAESASSLKAFFARRLDVPALLGTLTLERKACKSPFNFTSSESKSNFRALRCPCFQCSKASGTMRLNDILSNKWFQQPRIPAPESKVCPMIAISGSFLRRYLREKRTDIRPIPSGCKE